MHFDLGNYPSSDWLGGGCQKPTHSLKDKYSVLGDLSPEIGERQNSTHVGGNYLTRGNRPFYVPSCLPSPRSF